MERFQDENKWLGHFANEIFVRCPKCECKSSIIRNKIKRNCKCGECYDYSNVFECKHCFYKLEKQVYQYIAYGNPYCNNCFEKYEFESQALKEKPEKYRVKCPHCGFHEELKPKIKELLQNAKIDDGLARENWYNLPLWFQKEIKGNIFWVYNYEHIMYLEKYIKADLRERNNNGSGNGTMVSRLPKFIKEAKNREKLLKILEKWKE